ncbi:MAG: hypothetical protein IJY82_03635 [Oscillospiraceae bacterium]|nr:hypothetical protein [Oscillospiraceae bacterium]
MAGLFGNNISPSCDYCAYGTLSPAGDVILCEKRGIMALGNSCRKFEYDPLKRVPKEPIALAKFSEEDFKL